MHRMRPKVLLFGVGVMALAAVLVLMLASLGSASTAQAGPPPTPKPPEPTPKPNDGNLGGTYDVMVPQRGGLYHCILKLDHNGTTNQVKITTVCYADLELGDTEGEPPDYPNDGEGPDLTPGLPPPPPYSILPPAKGNGVFDKGANKLTFTVCFRFIGGPNGPNIIARVNILDPKGQLAGGPPKSELQTMEGTVDIFFKQSNAQCEGKSPSGTPGALPLKFTRVQLKDGSPGASPGKAIPGRVAFNDFDGDTCNDAAELDKQAPKGLTDPFNPHDCGPKAADLSGNYNTLAIVKGFEADCNKDPGPPPDCIFKPGVAYHCISDLQHDTGTNALTARIYCYIDIPGIPVNSNLSMASGDGSYGSPPPRCQPTDADPASPMCVGPDTWGDLDSTQTVLNGTYDKGANTTNFTGCFRDEDGSGSLGNVYVQSTQDAHTGIGSVNIYINQAANCAGSPTGDPQVANLLAVRQANKDIERDTDGDGCPDKRELSDNQQSGGRRDPYNRWDYFNPTDDGQNRVDDILAAVNKYFIDYPAAGYTYQTDRQGIPGSNPWNLRQGNGQHRVDDILAAVNGYFHDCGSGGSRVNNTAA